MECLQVQGQKDGIPAPLEKFLVMKKIYRDALLQKPIP